MKVARNRSYMILAFTICIVGCQHSAVDVAVDSKTLATDNLKCLLAHAEPAESENIRNLNEGAQRGSALCLVYLADLYEHGRGVAQDIPHAKSLYLIAAQIDVKANFQLGRLAEEGIGEPVDYVAARTYYRKALVMPNQHESGIRLAHLLENGKGGPADLPGSMALYVDLAGYSEIAREGVHRLQALGVALSDSQRELYENAWLKNSLDSLYLQHHSHRQALLQLKPFGPNVRPAKLRIRYVAGSLNAEIELLESSNDTAFDQYVLSVVAGYKFPYEPMLEPQTKVVSLIYEVDPHSL